MAKTRVFICLFICLFFFYIKIIPLICQINEHSLMSIDSGMDALRSKMLICWISLKRCNKTKSNFFVGIFLIFYDSCSFVFWFWFWVCLFFLVHLLHCPLFPALSGFVPVSFNRSVSLLSFTSALLFSPLLLCFTLQLPWLHPLLYFFVLRTW